MSSTVQCFPMLPTFQSENSAMNSLLQNQFLQPPTSTASALLEKMLAAQTTDPLTYLAALLPSMSQASIQNPPMPQANSGYVERSQLSRNVTKRRNRTTFTHEQAAALEREYSLDQYMPRSRRAVVAENLNLTESQVKTWFQNRRAKDRRFDKFSVLQNVNSGPNDEIPRSSGSQSPQNSKQLTPTFDKNFLMPPVPRSRTTSSPTSSATTSSNPSPISPLSPFFNNPVSFLANLNSTSPVNSSAALTALYLQALQLQANASHPN